MASFASTEAAWTKKISENHGQLRIHGSCLDPKERAKVGVNNGQYIRLNQERKKKKKKVSAVKTIASYVFVWHHGLSTQAARTKIEEKNQ